MVVDSSALVALVLGEPGAERIAQQLQSADEVVIAAPTLVEATIVVDARLGAAGVLQLHRVLAEAQIEVAPFDERHSAAAVDGWRRFGKGRHPAGLNLGDCFGYALAMRRGDTLLFLGNDFKLTDVLPAIEASGPTART